MLKRFKHSEETKNKMSILKLGHLVSTETRKKISLTKRLNPTQFWFGKKFSEEHRRKLSLAHAGKAPSNKGVPMPEETKLKISLTKIGLPSPCKGIKRGSWGKHSLETKLRLSENKKEEKNPNWRGGITKINYTEREIIKNTFEYKNWRKKVFERDNYQCQVCEKRGGKLNADHIKPFSLYPGLRFILENGRTLCVDCHRKTDTYGGKVLKFAVINNS